jgi:hypothetical protein
MSKDEVLENIQHDLPIDEDIPLAKKSFPIQIAGWSLLYIFLIAALLGFFGKGYFSIQENQVNGINLVYEKYGRNQMPMNLELDIQQVKDSVLVSVPQEYFKHVQLRSVTPEPAEQRIDKEYYTFVFKGNGSLKVFVEVEPRINGSVSAGILAGNTTIPINQYFYP